MICPDDSDRLAQSVGEIFRPWRVRNGKRNRVAFDFGGPSGHVAEQIDGQRHIGGARDAQRFAIVEAFDIAELFGVRFEQVGEFPDEAAAFGGGQLAPRTVIEGFARRLHGQVDILAVAFGHLREHFAGGGIVCGKCLAGNGVDPLSVDQHFARLVDKLRDLWMNLRGSCDTHDVLLLVRTSWFEKRAGTCKDSGRMRLPWVCYCCAGDKSNS